MSDAARADLWGRLTAAGLVKGELPDTSGSPSPWYVRLMLGVAGWIGAIFLLLFVGAGLAFVFRNEAAAMVVGLMCCAGAYAIFAVGSRSELARQFGLAVSLAGQVMFLYGLHEGAGFDSESPVFFVTVAVFEAALAFVLANFVHRVWSALAAGIAITYALNLLGLWGYGVVALAAGLAALWLTEDEWAPRGASWRAIGYGLACALVQPTSYVATWFFWRSEVPPLFGAATFYIKAVLLVGVLVYAVLRILTRYDVAPSSRDGAAALMTAIVIGAVTSRAPGITASLIVIVLGFARGNRGLVGFGILALLSYLSYFYYLLGITLLMKSIVLAVTGLALIGMWAAMRAMYGDAARETVRA